MTAGALAAGALLAFARLAYAAPFDVGTAPPTSRVAVTHIAGSTGTVIVQHTSGAPVAAVELWYRAPSIGFGATPMPSLARVAAQTVAASKPLVGPSLGERVSALGGKLGIAAYGDSVSIAALVPSDAARDIVKAMTIAYFSPVITEEGFNAAARDVAMEALVSSFDAATVVRNDVFAQLFASGPQHYPAVGTAKDVSAVTLSAVRSFAQRAFRAPNAVLVVSGDVDASVAGAASHGRAETSGSGSSAESPTPSQLVASPPDVRRPFDQAAAGYAWAGPPIASEQEATAMDFIADYLFRPDAGITSRAIAEQFPGAFVSGQFITLHDPGVMFVAFGDGDLDGLRALVERAIAQMRTPLAAETFANARAAFEYHLLSDLQTPSEMADNFGWYSVEGNLQYAPGINASGSSYFSTAATLTPQFVARVAEKYLAKPAARAVLVPGTQKGQRRASSSS